MPISLTVSTQYVPKRELQRIGSPPSRSQFGFMPVNATTGALQVGGVDPRNNNNAFPVNQMNLLGFLTGSIKFVPEKREISSTALDGSKISVLEKLDAVNFECTALENPMELCMLNRNTRFRFFFPMGERQDGAIDVMVLGIGKLPIPEFETSNEFMEYPLTIMGEVNSQAITVSYLQIASALGLTENIPEGKKLMCQKLLGLAPVGTPVEVVKNPTGPTYEDGTGATFDALFISSGQIYGFGSFNFYIADI